MYDAGTLFFSFFPPRNIKLDLYQSFAFFTEWQRAWDKPVLDRVGLIIEIFNAHAYTKEAKLQVLRESAIEELQYTYFWAMFGSQICLGKKVLRKI